MTEQTIRVMAKELAGKFYEDNRTTGFRRAFPTLKAYMRGQWYQPNGDVKIDKPGWVHHIALAKKILTTMLSQSDAVVSPHVKERIYDALLDEHSRSTSQRAKQVTQRIERPH